MILASDIQLKPGLLRLVRKLEILVLDEISMVRADILDGINRMLQLHRKNNLPFGGVRLIVFGDIYQLPPIVNSIEENSFSPLNTVLLIFSSHIWRSLENIHFISLSTIYRQTDRRFIRLLDDIRHGIVDYDTLEEPQPSSG